MLQKITAADFEGSIEPGPGSITITMLDNTSANGTGSLSFPVGTTAQRPSTANVGSSRWNTTLNALEVYVGNTTWQVVASTGYSLDYLIVAGGGGGGNTMGGGGGGGGAILGSPFVVSPGASYAITIGTGGAGATSRFMRGTSGTNTSALGMTALGGGGGGSWEGPNSGISGGSGGGCAGSGGTPGSGTAGQGFAGSAANGTAGSYARGGGGGGGGATTLNFNGGIGLLTSISGVGTYYAGGGGGGSNGATSVGGAGGGGNGTGDGTTGGAGSINTGGGAGAGGYPADGPGGAGGSGIVILSYVAPSQRGTGGVVTTANGRFIHTFTSSGTFIA